jgi:hypothetical protein
MSEDADKTEARAEQIRADIRARAKSGGKKPAKPGKESPRDFIHRRMSEIDD